MASIGGTSVDVMRGRPDAPGETLQTIPPRPGENYNRTRKLGNQTADVTIRTWKTAASASAADSLEATYKAKQATAVTIVDAHGVSHTNVMILNVQCRLRPIIESGASKYEVEAFWTCRKGAD